MDINVVNSILDHLNDPSVTAIQEQTSIISNEMVEQHFTDEVLSQDRDTLLKMLYISQALLLMGEALRR